VRLFAAIDLSAETREAMASEQRRLKQALGSSGASPKWVRPDNAHLTLVFLGQVADERVAPLIADIGRDITRPVFEIELSTVGMFPDHGAPRVLWIGVATGAEALMALQHELAARIAGHGIALDTREFHPHLTLARWSRSRPSDRARVHSAAGADTLARQPVTGVTLYECRLLPSGAHYTALTRANLTGAWLSSSFSSRT
jgi:RNA 2',3'-cyclic 3'-phosphodiesterase